jgi:transcriptional regulator with XRE-family HTH domain
MGMKALGSYIRELRRGQRMTVAYVAEQTGLNASTLHRIEKGETEPGGENILNLVAVVKGNYDDARRLWSDRNADEARGRALAEARLSQFVERTVDQAINGMGHDEARRLAQRLRRDPAFLEQFIRQFVDDSEQ